MDGAPREDFHAGDRLVLHVHVEAPGRIEPPRLAIELRDANGALLGRSERELGELGWDGSSSRADVRFEVESLPLVEGRFQLNVSLTDDARTRRYHTVERAAEFTVHPQGRGRGLLLFEGDWALEQPSAVQAETA